MCARYFWHKKWLLHAILAYVLQQVITQQFFMNVNVVHCGTVIVMIQFSAWGIYFILGRQLLGMGYLLIC